MHRDKPVRRGRPRASKLKRRRRTARRLGEWARARFESLHKKSKNCRRRTQKRWPSWRPPDYVPPRTRPSFIYVDGLIKPGNSSLPRSPPLSCPVPWLCSRQARREAEKTPMFQAVRKNKQRQGDTLLTRNVSYTSHNRGNHWAPLGFGGNVSSGCEKS